MTTCNGVVLYDGPSVLDGAPIVVIATGLVNASENPKTGAMVQVWILRSDVHPAVAKRTGEDSSICGDCVHRPYTDASGWHDGTCYVSMNGPASVYRQYQAGKYGRVVPSEAREILAGRQVRLGAYGDPGAVPFDVLARCMELAHPKSTGYTHAWRRIDPRWAGLVMASCDSIDDYRAARSSGYRAFLVVPQGTGTVPGLIPCVETVTGRQCMDCGACNGTSRGERPNAVSVFIRAHGTQGARFVGA